MVNPRQAEREQLRVLGEREFVASLVRDTQTPVLEIGAGTCACLTLVLAVHGLRILALDRDEDALADARRILAGVDLLKRTTLMQADAAALPLGVGSIRSVVAHDALHHTADMWGTVAEIARTLDPRGRLTQALRAHFRKVTITPREERRVYVCEKPRRRMRRAGHGHGGDGR